MSHAPHHPLHLLAAFSRQGHWISAWPQTASPLWWDMGHYGSVQRYIPQKKPWFIRKLIIIQNHSSSLPIIFPSKLTFWSPRFLDHPYMCPRLVDAGTIFPSNFQLSVEVFPTVLHVMQEEVLCVFTGVGHVLRTGKLAGLVTGTVFEYVKMMDEWWLSKSWETMGIPKKKIKEASMGNYGNHQKMTSRRHNREEISELNSSWPERSKVSAKRSTFPRSSIRRFLWKAAQSTVPHPTEVCFLSIPIPIWCLHVDHIDRHTGIPSICQSVRKTSNGNHAVGFIDMLQSSWGSSNMWLTRPHLLKSCFASSSCDFVATCRTSERQYATTPVWIKRSEIRRIYRWTVLTLRISQQIPRFA